MLEGGRERGGEGGGHRDKKNAILFDDLLRISVMSGRGDDVPRFLPARVAFKTGYSRFAIIVVTYE